MKYFTELIVFHEDTSMPNEKTFCPILWESNSYDSDGDYYYDGIDARWTQLKLESEEAGELNSKLNIQVYRSVNQNYNPSLDSEKLMRYIDYREQGEYDNIGLIKTIKNPAIASFQFETFQSEHYLDFLKSVHTFLKYSKGIIVNYSLYHDADSFFSDFLDF